MRSAEAFGATGVLFLKGAVNPYNPKTLRASSGSLFRLPAVSGLDADIARAALQQARLDIYTAMPGAARQLQEVDFRRKCAIVVGSEGQGVSPLMRGIASDLTIPTSGVESLNAAVAGSISPLSGPVYDLTDTVKAYTALISPSKVILGVPWYGRAWSTPTDACGWPVKTTACITTGPTRTSGATSSRTSMPFSPRRPALEQVGDRRLAAPSLRGRVLDQRGLDYFAVVLAQCGGLLPRPGIQPHQRDVRFLVPAALVPLTEASARFVEARLLGATSRAQIGPRTYESFSLSFRYVATP